MEKATLLQLICLAPEPECEPKQALHLAAGLAALLNFDEELPVGIRRPPGSPLETAESVLSFAKKWCLGRNARFHAIVLDNETAIGSISLSHIDILAQAARSGYWLGSAYQGRGYGTEALSKLVAIARECGLKRLSATISVENEPSKRIWEKLGAHIREDGGRVQAIVDLS
jgi:RimJ/RimL family protein N-acetyltransferase